MEWIDKLCFCLSNVQLISHQCLNGVIVLPHEPFLLPLQFKGVQTLLTLKKDMKRILLAIFTLCILSGAFKASAQEEKLFVYPVPPDTMTLFQPRVDYIVTRFWDRCNFETARLHPKQFNQAFGDWMDMVPHASADTVFNSVNKLLKRFEKKGDIILDLATMAENWLYADTAAYFSTELYLPFARAAATNKKISKAERARFAHQVKLMESSMVGATVPDIPMIYADGRSGTLADIKGKSVVLFINDPDCMDCTMARIRLSADPNTRDLIDRGELDVVSIYPGDTSDEEWEKAKANAVDGWVTVAMPDAYDYFDVRQPPLFIFLNSRHKVLVSGINDDYLLASFRVANQLQKRKNSNVAAEATDSVPAQQ